ncbi:MAG TPA: FAD-dependent monooxygenase [Mucilaginibacter sp.]|jgi:2-polyprenyl-6-methoxyphenol hydroxylase-like FAD-dependent oxidoreductase
MTNETHTKVLVVGAGPSGLMMAAQLLRYGIQPVIIDSKHGPTDESKALGVQARSLEIYRQMGLIDPIIKGGKKAQGVSFNRDGKNVASFPLTNIGEGQTFFPFIEFYQQSKNERLLLDYLTQNCCPVYWNTSLVSLRQTGSLAEIQLKNGADTWDITCDWVIGADGAHSLVRQQLNIPFSGDTYRHIYYLADVELGNKELGDTMVNLFLGKTGLAGFFPMPEANRYRIIGNLPDILDKKKDLRLDDVLPYLNNICGFDLQIVQNYWFTDYRLHHRMADKFRKQRCFLAGDAAHIHSPVGAQGMNTGLQDAYNLAWKLAGVINNQLKPAVLDSYAAERMPVAQELLGTTDRIFTIIMSNNVFTRLFKKWIMFRLLKWAWNNKTIKKELFKRVSQIGITYRNSPINLHMSHASKIKAGDRLPYLKVYDEKKREETDLHTWCSKPGFTLIILGKFDELFLFNIARWITVKYSNVLNFFYLPPSGKNLDVFNAFEVNPHLQKSIIIRPDMHIGFINDQVDTVLMDNYLKNIVGIKESP